MTIDSATLVAVADVVASVLFLAGAFLVMVAGIGIARFPDLLSRMHAATKPQVLGLGMVLTGLALELRIGWVVWTLVLVLLFQLTTGPVSAHMVGRAGYRTGRVRRDLLVVDELTEDLEAAEQGERGRVAGSDATKAAEAQET